MTRSISEVPKEKTRPNFIAQLEPNYEEQVRAGKVAPRKHPGALDHKVSELPVRLVKSIEKLMGDHPPKKLADDGRSLDQYLKARHVPPEESSLKLKASDIQAEVEAELNKDVSAMSEEQFQKYRKMVHNRVDKILKSRTFAWKPLDFDEYRSKIYLFARAAQDYAAISWIFKEIQKRDPNFKPHSFFDFGSGVGSGTWAVSELWKEHIYEYFNVDSSASMNDLAEMILKDGADNKERALKNMYFRQFLGAPTVSLLSSRKVLNYQFSFRPVTTLS